MRFIEAEFTNRATPATEHPSGEVNSRPCDH
jgi:hypothetical protein